jgi:5-methylcytosine-specific restriction protein A|nr:MAG TPA: HNH endonuclease [Caudoviricetes sp.]
MPLLKLCSYPGCHRPVARNEKYCEQHQKAGLAREKKMVKDREALRLKLKGNSSERGYGYRWQMLRNRFIAQHPYCEQCLKEGRITLATDVDHIIPHRGNVELLYDEKNLQSLCKACHSRKTASEDGGFGNPTDGGARKMRCRQ